MADTKFSTAAIFKGTLVSGTDKQWTVRFPTDAEWCDVTKKRKLVKVNLGRGKSMYESKGSEKVDLALYEKIKQDGSADLDEYEAAKVIAKLDRTDIIAAQRSADTFKVHLNVAAIETEHILRIPTQRQIMEFSRAAVQVYAQRRTEDIRSSLEPGGTLYDALLLSHDGYEGLVPVTHKSVVISEIINQLDNADGDEDF